MKRSEVDTLGESLRRRKLSGEEVNAATERAWAELRPEADGVAEDVLRDLQPVRRSTGIAQPLWLAVAAAIVLAIVLSSVLLPRPQHAVAASGALLRVSGETSEAIQPGGRIAFGEVIRSQEVEGMLTLADGSRIEMRPRSEVFLESASDGVRIRLNRGAVIVTAAMQRSGHLYVQTKDVTVSVIGTVFLVNVEAEGSRVAVIQGEVHVQQGDISKKLLAGEQVATGPSMEALPVSEEISWSRSASTHLALLQKNADPPALATPARREFSAISIKPYSGMAQVSSGVTGFACHGIDGTGRALFGTGEFTAPQGRCVGSGNVFIADVIAFAYGMSVSLPESGEADWTRPAPPGPRRGGSRAEAFQIEAVAEDPSTATLAQLKEMVQSMLADRFKLKVRRDMREFPGYALLVAKNAPKLKEAPVGEESSFPGRNSRGQSVVRGKSSLDAFARFLGSHVGAPVVNKTELPGIYEYEFVLSRAAGGGERAGAPVGGTSPLRSVAERAADTSGLLEDQFGLRLQAEAVRTEILVVEQIDKPSSN